MAIKELVFQGFTARTHAAVLNELLATDAQRVIFGVAFVTETGAALVEEKLALHAAHLSVFAGIRNEITSVQGLKRLHKIGGELFTVDTAKSQTLFHPKLFYVRGAGGAHLLIGSANLTRGGLNTSIEASAVIKLDADDAKSLEELFDGLPASYPSNILKAKSAVDIEGLWQQGLLVDEGLAVAPKLHPPKGAAAPPTKTPPIKLKTKFIVVAKKKPPTPAKPTLIAKSTGSGPQGYVYVWKSKPLQPSNIDIVTSSTANPKGVLSLGQGGFEQAINFQTYFRNSVFAALSWSPSALPGVDEAFADFEFVLGGVNYGTFPHQRIRYSKSTATVKQKNVTTRFVWGNMLPLVSKSTNLGRTVYLFRDVSDPTKFLLEID